MARFVVAGPSEYLAITGWGIDDVKLAKKAWVFAGQKCSRFDISPVNYEFNVEAMSSEKLAFNLPAVFTIGPKITPAPAPEVDGASNQRRVLMPESEEALLLYAKLIAPHDHASNHVKQLVKGVIEGETRVLAASMTMEEIFQGTKKFKQEVFDQVQLDLNKFGLYIYNANVKQLVDEPGHEYFSYLGKKTQQEAANKAKVDVAEERMKGEVGAKEREGLTRQNAAKVDAETKVVSVRQQGIGLREEAKVKAEVQVYENEREAEIAAAQAGLAMKKAGWEKQSKVAQVEAVKAVAIREAELQMESNAALYNRQKAADATLYEQVKSAEARKAQADAMFFEQKLAEDARLYAKQKEAEALAMVGKAKVEYVTSMLQALGGDYGALRDYLMIDGGMYQEMARVNASAVSGMQPKISIWSGADGAAGEAGAGAMQQVAGVYKMLPPLLSTVHEQTGMQPPAWMGSLPKDGAN
uniref:Flotillin-like n=1 Tax=Oryza barthii TaxID=65489 RepID=A0A0D3HEU4_9ORYZ